MAVEWDPADEVDGCVRVGLAPRQEWAYALLGALAPSALFVVTMAKQGGDTLEALLLGLGVLVGLTVTLFLVRSRTYWYRTLRVSDESVEIRRRLGAEKIPWGEISDITLDHWWAKGGTVVVLEGAERIVLAAPVSARRILPTWFADPDFEAKVAYLRSHLDSDVRAS